MFRRMKEIREETNSKAATGIVAQSLGGIALLASTLHGVEIHNNEIVTDDYALPLAAVGVVAMVGGQRLLRKGLADRASEQTEDDRT